MRVFFVRHCDSCGYVVGYEVLKYAMKRFCLDDWCYVLNNLTGLPGDVWLRLQKFIRVMGGDSGNSLRSNLGNIFPSKRNSVYQTLPSGSYNQACAGYGFFSLIY